MPRYPLFACALLVAATPLLGALLTDEGSPSPAPRRPAAQAPARDGAQRVAIDAPADEPPMSSALRMVPGQVAEYDLTLEQVLEPTTNAASPGPSVRLAARGRLVATCYDAHEEGLVVGQRFEVERVEIEGLPEAAREDIERAVALRPEVLLRVDRRGVLLAVALPPGPGPRGRDVLRSWVSALQVALPLDAGARGWRAPAWDPAGPAEDAYEPAASGARELRSARTRRYLERPGLPPIEARGRTAVSVRRHDGLLVSIEGALGISLGAGEQWLTFVTQVRAELRAEARLTEAELCEAERRLERASLDAHWEREPAHEAPEGEAPGVAPLRPLEEVLEELSRSPESAFLELVRILEAHDDAVERVRDGVLVARDPEAQRRLVDALAAAAGRRPAAQQALVALALQVPEHALPNVFVGLGELVAPLPEVVELLVGAVDRPVGPHRTWAVQAAGLLARNAEDGAVVERLTGVLEEGLARAADVEEKTLLLDALGAAARQRSFEVILPAVDAEEPEVRSRALLALRDVEGEEVTAVLVDRLVSDEDEGVRAAAARALERRPAADALVGLEGAFDDSSGLVREAAVGAARSWLEREDLAEGERRRLMELLARAAIDQDVAAREAASEVARAIDAGERRDPGPR